MKFTSPYTPEELRIRLRNTTIYGFFHEKTGNRFYVVGWYRKGKFHFELPADLPERHKGEMYSLQHSVAAKGKITPIESGSSIEIRFTHPIVGTLFVSVFCLVWLVLAGVSSWHQVKHMPIEASIWEQLGQGLIQFFTSPFLLPIIPAVLYARYGYRQARRLLKHRLKLIMEWEETVS